MSYTKYTFARFANLMYFSGLNKEEFWNIVKHQRITFLKKYGNTLSTNLCFYYDDDEDVLDIADYMDERMKAIERKLELSGSEHMNHDINQQYRFENDLYEEAGKMFIYFNLCPKFMYDWTQLYMNLMQNASPDYIVKTLNRIIVTGEMMNDKIVVGIAKKIFMKITHILNLQFQNVDRYLNDSRTNFEHYSFSDKNQKHKDSRPNLQLNRGRNNIQDFCLINLI